MNGGLERRGKSLYQGSEPRVVCQVWSNFLWETGKRMCRGKWKSEILSLKKQKVKPDIESWIVLVPQIPPTITLTIAGNKAPGCWFFAHQHGQTLTHWHGAIVFIFYHHPLMNNIFTIFYNLLCIFQVRMIIYHHLNPILNTHSECGFSDQIRVDLAQLPRCARQGKWHIPLPDFYPWARSVRQLRWPEHHCAFQYFFRKFN